MNFLDSRLPDRFWSKCIPEPMSGCWLWIGSSTNDGYGKLQYGGSNRVAHRYSFVALVGPIPEGLQLDHLCRTRCCVNPAHLEPVTNRENGMRGTSVAAQNAAKTHCDRGHEYTAETTLVYRGRRYCRPCRAAAERARRAERAA